VAKLKRDNRSAAQKFRQKSAKALNRLSRFPNSGPIIAEFPELPYREVFIKPYRIFYRINGPEIWILAIWHSSQLPDEPDRL
jgi:toxin ParE1/3/4